MDRSSGMRVSGSAKLGQQFLTLAALVSCLACSQGAASTSRHAGASFTIPAAAVEKVQRVALPGVRYDQPNPALEVDTLFQMVYAARTLPRGGVEDPARVKSLVDGAYADYTLPLSEPEIRDEKAGLLVEVNFSGVNTRLKEWDPAADGKGGVALVVVTRTRTDTRTDRVSSPQMATFQFVAARRQFSGDSVYWVVTDFLNPVTNRWVSEATAVTPVQVRAELPAFFAEFYDARTYSSSHPIDLASASRLSRLSYQAYTLPLIQREQAEAASGALVSISYAGIEPRLISWDSAATPHGGVATVAVTRTAHETRREGVVAPDTATYQFRLHRHTDDAGTSYWMAIDFLRPDLQRWVSDLGGQSVGLPAAGHG